MWRGRTSVRTVVWAFLALVVVGAAIRFVALPSRDDVVAQPSAEDPRYRNTYDEGAALRRETAYAQAQPDGVRKGNALLGIGIARSRRGEKDEAMRCWKAALAQFQKARDREGISNTAPLIARDQVETVKRSLDAGQANSVRQGLNQLLVLIQGLAANDAAFDVVSQCANLAVQAGSEEQARAFYERGIELAREIGGERQQASFLAGLADCHVRQKRARQGEACAKAAIFYFRRLGDRRGVGAASSSLGAAYLEQGRTAEALAARMLAYEVARELGDRRWEAGGLGYVAQLSVYLGRYEEAARFARRAASLMREFGDLTSECTDLSILVQALVASKEAAEAKAACRELLQRARSQGGATSDQTGWSLLTAARALSISGSAKEGVRTAEEAEAAFAKTGNLQGQAASAEMAARTSFNVVGDIGASLRHAARWLDHARKLSDVTAQAWALCFTGYAYSNLGLPSRALIRYSEVKRLAQLPSGVPTYIRCELATLEGWALADLGELAPAAASYRTVLALALADRNRYYEAGALECIGELELYYRGNEKRAIAWFDKAIARSQWPGLEANRAWAHRGLGDAYARMGLWARAEREHRRALALFHRTGPQTIIPAVASSLGTDLQGVGRSAEAKTLFRTAILLHETQRASLDNKADAKERFHAQHTEPYDRYGAQLLAEGRSIEAFAVLQGLKARRLLETVASAQSDRWASALGLGDIGGAFARLNDRLLERLATPDQNQGAAIAEAQEVEELFGESAEREAGASASRKAQMFKGLTPADLAGLPQDTAILDYNILDAGSSRARLFQIELFALTNAKGGPRIDRIQLRTDEATLRRAIQALRRSCAERRGGWKSRALALWRILILPARTALVGKRRLIVCPDGPLWDVPFQVLLDDQGTTLVDRFEIGYAQSATAEMATIRLAAQSSTSGLDSAPLVVASPEPAQRSTNDELRSAAGWLRKLKGADREASAIAKVFPDAVVLRGKDAQESAVKRRLGEHRYVHFATHGMACPDAPMLSNLVLAPPELGSADDGFLTALEIAEQSLRAELVVLSACDTGRGSVRKGEGMVGLAWAFQAAGARSQVVTQWAVDDESTADFMRAFYRRLRQGMEKGTALRAAALELRKDGRHGNPYYWAPFMLVGDWR